MDFHNLAYWQQKARELTIETRLFINGEYSAAADNSVFETNDPAAQQTLAEVARGKKADVDRAVQAARSAGLLPFCITIDETAHDYLPLLFGDQGYALVRRPQRGRA